MWTSRYDDDDYVRKKVLLDNYILKNSIWVQTLKFKVKREKTVIVTIAKNILAYRLVDGFVSVVGS